MSCLDRISQSERVGHYIIHASTAGEKMDWIQDACVSERVKKPKHFESSRNDPCNDSLLTCNTVYNSHSAGENVKENSLQLQDNSNWSVAIRKFGNPAKYSGPNVLIPVNSNLDNVKIKERTNTAALIASEKGPLVNATTTIDKEQLNDTNCYDSVLIHQLAPMKNNIIEPVEDLMTILDGSSSKYSSIRTNFTIQSLESLTGGKKNHRTIKDLIIEKIQVALKIPEAYKDNILLSNPEEGATIYANVGKYQATKEYILRRSKLSEVKLKEGENGMQKTLFERRLGRFCPRVLKHSRFYFLDSNRDCIERQESFNRTIKKRGVLELQKIVTNLMNLDDKSKFSISPEHAGVFFNSRRHIIKRRLNDDIDMMLTRDHIYYWFRYYMKNGLENQYYGKLYFWDDPELFRSKFLNVMLGKMNRSSR
ncbi:hypothetical protein KAFR_0H02970 [Kazachstania africana CBS 2517]|uniref:Uncharacterized protein n=1 Tax=Kazachstania africana (strain ATCC 22294 / BCRC 22015 / CBS 2517 / CECT 1963 / NBRC 1671 / NRRL Y-8276) TaxID=1071382 RepID=H2AZF0_KAZAF|nr:hypothetical protein KAFR_0H02970 [Kazachstania africana CBS 2517]CCF59706.1 hypothetical protein KAFR_0H02970 [Kazachstania africana CBS 2517]